MKLHVELHSPLTEKQKRIIRSDAEHLVIKGPAGTAKTYSALARGLLSLSREEVERIIIIRSPVEIRQIGLLPGDVDEKVEQYAAPYIDLLTSLSPKHNYKSLVQKKLLEFMPTTFLRGRTFDNCFIIADEFQNLSAHEFETIITRVGVGTQLVIVGDDTGQSDLSSREAGEFREVLDVTARMPEFETHTFDVEDILRSGLVRSYYEARDHVHLPRMLSA